MEQTEQKDDGDGDRSVDEVLKGPAINLRDLRQLDSMIGGRVGQNVGVLIRAMSAHKYEDIEQELKLANFQTTDEADEFVSAITESDVLGMDPTPLMRQMYARSAGVKQGLLMSILQTLTHLTFTTNYQKDKQNAAAKVGRNNPFR